MRKFLVIILVLAFCSSALKSQCTVGVSIGSYTICEYSGVNLYGYGTNINKYLWSPGNYTTAQITVGPSVTTTYTLIGYNYSGTTIVCSDTSTVVVYVVPFPNLQISASSTLICENDSAQIVLSGAQNYSWAPSPGNYTGSTVYVKPVVSTNYTVNGFNYIYSMYCSMTKEILIEVSPCTVINELKNNMKGRLPSQIHSMKTSI